MTEKDEQSLIAEVKRLHGELQNLATDALSRAIRIGELLWAVKPKLGHGGWLPWLQANIGFSERTAQNYMKVFQNQACLKSANVADLTEAYLTLSDQSQTSSGVGASKAIRSIIQEAHTSEATTLSSSWTPEEVKADKHLLEAFQAIDKVYGHDDTKAIRTGLIGLNRADVAFLAKLPEEKMLEIQDLVMAERMKPKHAFEFMNKMADDYSEVRELIQWCVGTKAKFWQGNFRDGAFTVTVKANRAITRK